MGSTRLKSKKPITVQKLSKILGLSRQRIYEILKDDSQKMQPRRLMMMILLSLSEEQIIEKADEIKKRL